MPALYVLRGLSCHMPVPVAAVELQRGWLAQVLAAPVREEEAGLGWPGACPDLLPHACRGTSLHTFDPTVSSTRIPFPSGSNPAHPSKPSQTPPVARRCP